MANSEIEEVEKETPLMDFFSSYLENYDIVVNGRKNPASKKRNFAKYYDALFSIKNIDTHEYVARHTCWHKNPFSAIKSFVTWKAETNPDDPNFGKYEPTNNGGEYLLSDNFLLGGFTKSLYCIIFKIIPWAHPIMFGIRYLWIFMSLLLKFLQLIFVGLGNTLISPIGGAPHGVGWLYSIFWLLGLVFIQFASLDGKVVGDVGFINYKISVTETKDFPPYVSHILYRIIGVATPYFLIFGEKEQQGQYGKGEFMFFILALMLVSGILIFFGGATISAVIFEFGYYCFKLMGELTNFKTEPDLSPSPSSTTTPSTTPIPKA